MLRIDLWGLRGLLAAPALSCLSCVVSTEEGVARTAEPVLYGADDRKDYYEIDDEPVRRLIADTLIALVPNAAVVEARG